MAEPYNCAIKIQRFDTFEDSQVHENDGNSDIVVFGTDSAAERQEAYLEDVINVHPSHWRIPPL